MRNGEGIHTYTVGNIKVTQNGIFKNDMFFSGEYLQSDNLDGTIVKTTFEMVIEQVLFELPLNLQ